MQASTVSAHLAFPSSSQAKKSLLHTAFGKKDHWLTGADLKGPWNRQVRLPLLLLPLKPCLTLFSRCFPPPFSLLLQRYFYLDEKGNPNDLKTDPTRLVGHLWVWTKSFAAAVEQIRKEWVSHGVEAFTSVTGPGHLEDYPTSPGLCPSDY